MSHLSPPGGENEEPRNQEWTKYEVLAITELLKTIIFNGRRWMHRLLNWIKTGTSLQYSTATLVSAGICHRSKVNSIAWLYRRAQPKIIAALHKLSLRWWSNFTWLIAVSKLCDCCTAICSCGVIVVWFVVWLAVWLLLWINFSVKRIDYVVQIKSWPACNYRDINNIVSADIRTNYIDHSSTPLGLIAVSTLYDCCTTICSWA